MNELILFCQLIAIDWQIKISTMDYSLIQNWNVRLQATDLVTAVAFAGHFRHHYAFGILEMCECMKLSAQRTENSRRKKY